MMTSASRITLSMSSDSRTAAELLAHARKALDPDFMIGELRKARNNRHLRQGLSERALRRVSSEGMKLDGDDARTRQQRLNLDPAGSSNVTQDRRRRAGAQFASRWSASSVIASTAVSAPR